MRKWIVKIALIAGIFTAGVVIGHNVNVYWGLNKGVTWGNAAGCEIAWGGVGETGCWIGQVD